MQTIDSLRAKIRSAEDLLAVVKTMKALAAVSIRHYEKAVAALDAYSRTVDLGLQALLHDLPDPRSLEEDHHDGVTGLIVFGTDQGLCGQFNERIATSAIEFRAATGGQADPMIVIGERCAALLEEGELMPRLVLPVPAGVVGIAPLVADLLVALDQWGSHEHIGRIRLLHNRPLSGALYETVNTRLLPLDRLWMEELTAEAWQSRSLPQHNPPTEALFSALVRQHLFVTIFRSCAESLAAEDASRLAAMQNAQRNIEDRLVDLSGAYHRQRQNSITTELLDIVSGSEAVSERR